MKQKIWRNAMTRRPGLTFSHVGFHATDVDRQADFYKSVLDFTETDRGTLPGPNGPLRLVFLSRDPDEHRRMDRRCPREPGVVRARLSGR